MSLVSALQFFLPCMSGPPFCIVEFFIGCQSLNKKHITAYSRLSKRSI